MSASLIDSSFNQVAFSDIQEHYCHQKDLECRFSVIPTSTPNSNDVIGILKVGWKSTKEFICSKTVEVPTQFEPETALNSSVVFTASELPKDVHEFYQFCYICHTDQRVHGISSPFQFVDDMSVIDWELIENEPQPASSVLTQLSQPEPSIVVIENDIPSALDEEKVKSVEQHYEAQIRDLKIQLHVVQQELASMNRDKDQSLNLQTTGNDCMTSNYQDAETKCQNKLTAASHDESFNLLTTVDELNKRYNDSENKYKETLLMLESTEIIISSSLLSSESPKLFQRAELKRQEEHISILQGQLNSALEMQNAGLADSTRKHREQINEVMHQKSNADAEIAILKNKLQQSEIEMKAASEDSLAKLLDLQEQLSAEKEKNNELDKQIRTWKDTQLAALGNSSTRLDSLKLSDDGANAAAAITKTTQCPVCDMEFPKDDPVQVNEAHVLAHLERVCPVCEEKFPPNLEERQLLRHVECCLIVNHQTKRKF